MIVRWMQLLGAGISSRSGWLFRSSSPAQWLINGGPVGTVSGEGFFDSLHQSWDDLLSATLS
jgi:hypothetical protein